MYFLLSQTADLLSCAGLEGVSKSVKRWRKIIPHCIKGTMWREREREREIVDVLKIGPIPFIDFNGIVLYLSLFGVKKQR